MERILVTMNTRYYAWDALGRAISLAKRIKARVFVLRVFSTREKNAEVEQYTGTSAERKLENIIQTARADLVTIEYFVTEGNFEKEVVRFIEYNKISLLVVEPGSWETNATEKGRSFIQDIMYRISCRVEVVSPKKYLKFKEKGD